MQRYLVEIDSALAEGDIKRAEVGIARQLRGQNTANERAELLFRRARARLLAARPDDALEDVQTGLALQPGYERDADVRILRGDVHFARFELAPVGFADRADTDAALQLYTQVIRECPEHPRLAWVYYQLGRVRLSYDDPESAQHYFRKVLESPCSPPNVHALSYERLGFIHLFENRHPADALTCFQSAITSYPQDSDTGWLAQLYLRMSRAHLELNEHDAALETARKALRETQHSSSGSSRAILPEAHLAIGNILAAMPGGEEEAIRHYLRYLQSSKRPPGIDVTWSQIHESLAELYFRLEQYQEAINAWEKALEYNPYHPWEINLRYQIARCYYRMRNYERTIEAIRQLQQAATQEQGPLTDWRVYNLLGSACFALEKYQEAATAYRRALELAPPGASEVEKAQIYLRFSEELMQSTD